MNKSQLPSYVKRKVSEFQDQIPNVTEEIVEKYLKKLVTILPSKSLSRKELRKMILKTKMSWSQDDWSMTDLCFPITTGPFGNTVFPEPDFDKESFLAIKPRVPLQIELLSFEETTETTVELKSEPTVVRQSSTATLLETQLDSLSISSKNMISCPDADIKDAIEVMLKTYHAEPTFLLQVFEKLSNLQTSGQRRSILKSLDALLHPHPIRQDP